MTSDLDIDRSAWPIIKHYRDNAIIRAAEPADALLDKGDMDGRAAWLRIIDKIREVQAREVPASTVKQWAPIQ